MSEDAAAAGWSEHRLVSFDRTPIFYRRYEGPQKSRAVLFILHGMGEHGGRYQALAEFLGQAGIGSLLPDARGFGRSGGKRGCVQHFEDYRRDLDAVYQQCVHLFPHKPFFILGHSFGGLLLSSWLAVRPKIKCHGMVLSSPNFGISIPIPQWRHWAGLLASHLAPDFTQDTRVDSTRLTHDAAVYKEYKKDRYIHHRISARLYSLLIRELSRAGEIASRIQCPSLVLQAGDDVIVSRRATETFFEKLGSRDKELKIYENLYHEILNETERPAIFARIAEWIQKRI